MIISGGFVNVRDILSLKNGQKYTVDDVKRVVANNSKQRFALADIPEVPELRIRANQGHSMQVMGNSTIHTYYTRVDKIPMKMYGYWHYSRVCVEDSMNVHPNINFIL